MKNIGNMIQQELNTISWAPLSMGPDDDDDDDITFSSIFHYYGMIGCVDIHHIGLIEENIKR